MKLNKIYWRDISGLSDRWMDKEELIEEAQKAFNTECITVGWVIHETDDYLLVSATTDQDGEYHDASMIMKSVILKIDEI